MIYSTGTISINGNTATGSGTNWTAPASQVRAGQTIIVMSNPVQLFQISSVNSATSMTVTPAVSPALSGQKYAILVSDIISVDGLAQAMSQLIKEYDENIGAWETFATTSANQSITVTINGTAVTIPSIGKLAQEGFVQLSSSVTSDSESQAATPKAVKIAMDNGSARLAKDRNLSDLPNTALARQNLELGDSSTRNVGTTAGTVASGDDARITGAMQKSQNGGDIPDVAKFLQNLGLTNAIIGDTCKEAGFYLGSALAPYLMHEDTHTAIRLVTLDSVHRVTTSTYTINYYANGLIHILGMTPTVSSLSSPTLTFPVAFPTACIRFALHNQESGVPSYNMAMYSNLSRTGAKIWGVANILGNSGSPTLGALPDAEISYEAWGY